MNLFKIALRSIQYRGLGSFLTILSMALGVMMVVAVLTIHGVVSKSFKSNSSFGYNIIMGARGGSMQLTLNTVFYLSSPIENIPYEYYMAFCDEESRKVDFENSITTRALREELASLELAQEMALASGGPMRLVNLLANEETEAIQVKEMRSAKAGLYADYVDVVVPICLGDYYEVPGRDISFRVLGTRPAFFDELVLDLDTGEKFRFAEGRNFEHFNQKNGYFEAVIGATVAKQSGLTVGSPVYPTHGVPSDPAAHVHAQGFEVVGVLEPTGTANDRVVFINMEGFYLMEDHAKPVVDEAASNDSRRSVFAVQICLEAATFVSSSYVSNTPLGLAFGPATPDFTPAIFAAMREQAKRDEADAALEASNVDPFNDGGWGDDEDGELEEIPVVASEDDSKRKQNSAKETSKEQAEGVFVRGMDVSKPIIVDFSKEPLPIEQREVTAVLIKTASGEGFESMMYDAHLSDKVINAGRLESTLNLSQFRPFDAHKSAQAVNPIKQIAILFAEIVDPIRLGLLFLTFMICVVSAISILVGIYNSMSQRKHEIAVMRALGANRNQVMMIMFLEALLLALAGGFLGWIGGHTLNAMVSPICEARTGVQIGFFDFAPSVPLIEIFGSQLGLPSYILQLKISPELLIIPALMLLAVLVGIYPAISAYRTDVSKSLSK